MTRFALLYIGLCLAFAVGVLLVFFRIWESVGYGMIGGATAIFISELGKRVNDE